MTALVNAVWAEFMKVKNSKIVMVTFGLFIFIPLMMGLMIYIVRNPELSQKLGLIAAKASLFGSADGPAFLGLINQLIATVGLIGFGFVTAWVFGREHHDKTMKDILALPVSRTLIVLAKCIVVFCWCLSLMIILFITAVVVGYIGNIEGWSTSLISQGAVKYLITGLLTVTLCTPVAFMAGYGRGIIAALGFVIITLIMGQFLAVAGLGAYFPWAIPGLYTVPSGTPGMELYPASGMILFLTSLTGLLATIYWWKTADHH
jgi:ABC-2 type transport system permease protein